jgi:hypothetical protein
VRNILIQDQEPTRSIDSKSPSGFDCGLFLLASYSLRVLQHNLPQSDKAALLVVPLERSRTRKVLNCKTWRPPDQDWRAPFRRPKISFNQGVKWKADINKYIDPIPPNGDAPCMAEQNMSGCPLL